MRRITIFLLTAILTTNWACNTPKTTLTAPKGINPKDSSLFSYQGEVSDSNVVILTEQEKKPSTFIMASIKRTGCYGKCPVYEAKILSDGTVLYYGHQFAEKQGEYKAYLTKNQIDSLITQADSAHFFDLQPLYPAHGAKIVDLPNTFTYFKKDTLEKEVINNHDAPKALKNLEQYLDQLLSRLEWETSK
jgi:hypothetical protein